MRKILKKIFTWTTDQAINKILEIHAKKGFCIVDYLYFAQIGAQRIFDTQKGNTEPGRFKNVLLPDYKQIDTCAIRTAYKQAITHADIVLPDGIALQLFYFFGFRKRLHNLNGTDFCPAFLEHVHKHHKMNLILYGTYPDLLTQTKKYLEKKWYTVGYAQDGYDNLNREQVHECLDPEAINVLLVARSNIQYPVQEIWAHANQDMIQASNLIVLNQWWTFDFRVGKQKRAPGFIRSLRLEWLRRVISDPRRNIKKIRYTLFFFEYISYYLLLKKE